MTINDWIIDYETAFWHEEIVYKGRSQHAMITVKWEHEFTNREILEGLGGMVETGVMIPGFYARLMLDGVAAAALGWVDPEGVSEGIEYFAKTRHPLSMLQDLMAPVGV